ncbi:hypothetical protein [Candidatus Palauibacter sp.]|uniref:hypothetical protein n=1 Tax=Candidatus Palauibacter sp. TaxID=3101350 RepID=UPI003B02DAA0
MSPNVGVLNRSHAVCVGVIFPALCVGYPSDSSRVFNGQESTAAVAIELTEKLTVAVPGGRSLRGAALSPTGDLIAAWFHGVPGIRLYRGSVGTDVLVRDVGRAIGVGFLDEGTMEIVDAAEGQAIVADTAGSVVSRRSLPAARQAGAAARTELGWFLALTDAVSPSIRIPGAHGAWLPDSTYARPISLGGGDAEALVWQSLSPFRAWRIGADTDWLPVEFQQVSPDWFDEDVAGSVRLNPGIWSTTSVVSIGPGYVQTLAHRSTDRRLLLWFDSCGRFVRHSAVDAPFGFVAGATGASIVLAVRTLNTTELVKYFWEEVPDSTEAAAQEGK